jgi:hypothetical protein
MRNLSNLKPVTSTVSCDSYLRLRGKQHIETRDSVTSFGFLVSTRGYIEIFPWKTRHAVVTGIASYPSHTVNLSALAEGRAS